MLTGCVHRQFVSTSYPEWGESHEFHSSDRSTPLILRTLAPPEPAAAPACVLLVHGMNEHIGRYGEVARHFAQQFTVAGFDFYAHGLSNPVLQQANHALRAGAAEQDVSDAYLAQLALRDLEPLRHNLHHALQRFMELCDAQGEPGRPVYIVAHSLGALVTASYLIQQRIEGNPVKRVQGVVLLAPGFAVSEPPGWRGWLANPLIKLSFHAETHFLYPHDEPLPVLVFNQFIAAITVPVLDGVFDILSWPGLRSVFSPISPTWVRNYLTDSEAEKARLRADGWIVRRTLLRYVKGIEEEIVHFRRRMDQFTLPYFLIYSAQDPITPAWGSEDFRRTTVSHHPDNAVLALPGLVYHQHLFLSEPMRSELLQKIEQWIHRRLHSTE
ncbi:alpha/beta fold hydrolase [Nitrosomonas sp. JL21]|nr:alpha/beta fold hydrolase [Nitrosomonas sp.]MXS77581.1 alpha/beta fold hydrolase [Nitrosomonas sp. JL21]